MYFPSTVLVLRLSNHKPFRLETLSQDTELSHYFSHPSSESANWSLLLKVKALDNEPQGMARSKAPTALPLQGEWL